VQIETTVATTPTMASLINRYGASYGWQKRWSDAPSEWWHFRYSSANDQHKGEKPKPKKKHPYHYLTKNEKHWRDVLRRERRIAKRHGGWDKVGDAHIAQAKTLLADARPDNPVGRKFDFLCQEFNREANTLCSKSADIELTRIGIDLKGAIELLRQQGPAAEPRSDRIVSSFSTWATPIAAAHSGSP
jgi:hypothetical protein